MRLTCESNYRVFREFESGCEQIFHTDHIVDAAFQLVWRISVSNPAENGSFVTRDSNQWRTNNSRLLYGFIEISGFIKISSTWHYRSSPGGIRPVIWFWSANPDMNTAVVTAKTIKPWRKPYPVSAIWTMNQLGFFHHLYFRS